MKIYGFQKLTLLDYPEHLAALVFTGGCNFRCPWCHNGDLIHPSSDMPCLDEREVLSQLERRASMLEGVVISGGEPTLQPDLRDFITSCRNMGYKIKLDTNGSRPEILIPLLEDGLVDYVAMDIKADKKTYGTAAGLENLDIDSIEKSIRFLIKRALPTCFADRSSKSETATARNHDHMAAINNVDDDGHSAADVNAHDGIRSAADANAHDGGHTAADVNAHDGGHAAADVNAHNNSPAFHYEFRTTVMPQYHDAASITAIAEWIRGAEKYFLQAYRDSEAVPEHGFTEPDSAFMQEMLAAAQAIIPQSEIRGL